MGKSDYRSSRNNGRQQQGLPGFGVPAMYAIQAYPPAGGRPTVLCRAWLGSDILLGYESIDVWRSAAQFSVNDCQLLRNTILQPIEFVYSAANEIEIAWPEVVPGFYEFWIRPGGRSFTSVHGIITAGVDIAFTL